MPGNPGTAAVLSLVIPGVGQFYNGDFWRGIFWLIVTPGLWIGLWRNARMDLSRHCGDHRVQASTSEATHRRRWNNVTTLSV